jgi:hypothetical protein
MMLFYRTTLKKVRFLMTADIVHNGSGKKPMSRAGSGLCGPLPGGRGSAPDSEMRFAVLLKIDLVPADGLSTAFLKPGNGCGDPLPGGRGSAPDAEMRIAVFLRIDLVPADGLRAC